MNIEQDLPKTSTAKTIVNILLVSLVYFILAFGSLQFARIPGNSSIFWIPTGFAIAVLINYGHIYGLALILGKIYLSYYWKTPVDEAIFSNLASLTEAYLGLYLFQSFKKTIDENFDFHRDLILISIISLTAPIISALIGVTSLLYNGQIQEDQYFFNWISWYTGDVLGAFIFLPAFIFSHLEAGEDAPKFQFFDILIPVLMAAITLLFQYDFLSPYIALIYFTILIPALIGSGRTLFYSLITVTLVFNYFLIRHIGPFSTGDFQDNLTSMQYFLFSLSFITIGLAGFKKTGLIKRAIFPLMFLWFLTGAVYCYYHFNKEVHDRKILETTVFEFNNRFNDKLSSYKNTFNGVAGFVSSSKEIDLPEWNGFIYSVSLVNQNQGLHSVSLVFSPDSKKDNLTFANLNFPLNSQNLTEILKKHELEIAMKNSREKGELVITPPILAHDGKINKLSYFVMPVFKKEQFIGWIISSIEMSKMISSIIDDGFHNIEIDIDVYAGIEPKPENLIFQKVVDSRFRNEKIDFKNVSYLDFAGQPLIINWNETSRFITQHHSQNSFIILVGAILSLVVTGFILSLRQVNEKAQKLANIKTRELSESEERFKSLFNNSSDAVVVFNEQRIIDCNPESLSIFGRASKKEMMLTHFPTVFIHENDDQFFIKKMKEAKAERMISFECQCFRNDVPFAAEVHLHYMVLKEKYLYQAVVRDISERKKIEANLIRSKELAEDAARAKSNFLSTMSHEIRTPLNGVIGMIDLLMEDIENSTIKDDLKTIKYSADNLLHVLNEVLDYNKIESGKMAIEKKVFSLKNLCDNLVKIYHSKSQAKRIELVLNYDHKLPEYIIGDEYRNSQILHNLLSNAIKFTNEGRVELNVSMISQNKDYCQVKFKVTDTGIGINEEKRRLIFEEFTQAESDHSRKYGGTGLGLSICQKLIEFQKGRLELQSSVNKGSAFFYTLTFALPTEHEIAIQSEQNTTHVTSFNNQKVLLAEDNDINVIVTKKFLEKWGLSVDVATNGIESVDKAKANSYHLILMDLHMPIMGGFEATKLIREFNKETPIIGLSADVMTELSHELKSTGMNDFVSKPFIPEEFLRKIRTYLS